MKQGIFILALLWNFQVFAEKMDLATHSVIIQKIETVLSQMPPQNPSYIPSLLRLADLYSERARLQTLEESQSSPQNQSLRSDKDRQTAILYYKKALNKAPSEQKAKILFQMAHLYKLLNQNSEAIALFSQIIKENGKSERSLVGEAFAGRGEIYYKQNQFSKAYVEFQSSLKIKETQRRGFITYRMSWCLLNMGQLQQATQMLLSILQKPELLKEKTTYGESVSESFHEDVSRDLVLFYARGDVTDREIENVFKYSSEKNKKQNIFYLGTETDRLGKPLTSLKIWNIFLKTNLTASERIRTYFQLSKIYWQLGHKETSVKSLNWAFEMWKKEECQEEDICQNLNLQVKKFIGDAHKIEKQKISIELSQLYILYAGFFKQDIEMNLLAAQVSRYLKREKVAYDFFKSSALISYDLYQKDRKNEKTLKIFNEALLGAIEMAEILKNNPLKEEAYNTYLKLNPKGSEIKMVSYQKSMLIYERQDYAQASRLFYEVVHINNGSEDLGKKAADLALDSLVLIKDPQTLKAWAYEFSEKFPRYKEEYLRIARNAIITEVALELNKKDKSSFSEEQKKMDSVNLLGATRSEQKLYFKNYFILAQKTRDFARAQKASSSLLALATLPSEKEEVMSQQLWIAELQLDFKAAFAVAAQMQFSRLSKSERLLKLALLAELSDHNPDKYYQDLLASSTSVVEKNLVRAKLIKRSSSPLKTLEFHFSELKKTPSLLADVVLEIYALHHDSHWVAKMFQKAPALASQESGLLLIRLGSLENLDHLRKKLSSQRILSQSDFLIQKTLTERLDFLKQAENHFSTAQQYQDWAYQVLASQLLEKEYSRLVKDLEHLPNPSQLKAREKAQYARLMNEKIKSFALKGYFFKQKKQELLSSAKEHVHHLKEEYQASSASIKPLLLWESRQMLMINDSYLASLLQDIKKEGEKDSELIHERFVLRTQVKEDPFNVSKLEKLKALEKLSGHDVMVIYLDKRIQTLNARGGA